MKISIDFLGSDARTLAHLYTMYFTQDYHFSDENFQVARYLRLHIRIRINLIYVRYTDVTLTSVA